MEPLDAEGCAQVDAALRDWRQGDCVIGEQWFVFRTDLERPLTKDGAVASAEGSDTAESEVFGFMVLTQTCDLVRKSKERPFVEVCPLVEVDEAQHREIERCRRPNYVFVPALAHRRLVADLDRVMTIEKAVVAGWKRVAGWQTDPEARRLALALEATGWTLTTSARAMVELSEPAASRPCRRPSCPSRRGFAPSRPGSRRSIGAGRSPRQRRARPCLGA